MCRSQAEGGQRCFAHAKERYETARGKAVAEAREQAHRNRPASATDRIFTNVAKAYGGPGNLHDARVALASTKDGAALVESWRTAADGPDRAALEAMWGPNPDAINDYLDRVQEHGRALAERNEAVRKISAPLNETGFRARARLMAQAFARDWRQQGGIVVAAAVTAYKGVHLGDGLGTAVATASVLALGYAAFTAWQNAKSSALWQIRKLERAHENRTEESTRREQATVRAVFERDVRRGVVDPTASAKKSYRDRVQKIVGAPASARA